MRSVLKILFFAAGCSIGALVFGEPQKPTSIAEALDQQFSADVARLFSAFAARDQEAIWSMASASTKEAFPRTEFDSHYIKNVLPRQSDWSVVYKRRMFLSDRIPPNIKEAYMVSIIRFKVDDVESFTQCIWLLDDIEFTWHYIEMPFDFVSAPLILKYPGLPATKFTQEARPLPVWPNVKNSPNQALLPTPTAVTPAASHPSRQP